MSNYQTFRYVDLITLIVRFRRKKIVVNLEFYLSRNTESSKPHFRSSKFSRVEMNNRFVMRLISIAKLMHKFRQRIKRLLFSECVWHI